MLCLGGRAPPSSSSVNTRNYMMNDVEVKLVDLGVSTIENASAGSLSTPVVTQTPVSVIEFYNPTLDHYFISADPVETTTLEAGILKGWIRTGYQFSAFSVDSTATSTGAP